MHTGESLNNMINALYFLLQTDTFESKQAYYRTSCLEANELELVGAGMHLEEPQDGYRTAT
jgi:hypothetical protein